jgi:hypothetical protein
MSSARANRFLHVELESSADNWLEWAVSHDIHPSVSGFIRFRPGMLFNQENENLERGWPTPRSWERVSTMMKILPENEEMLRRTVYGLVGNRAGVEFMAFHKTAQDLSVKEMMLSDGEITIPQKADLRYALCAGVAYHIWRGRDEAESKALLDGFFRISLALSSDFAAMLMLDVMKGGEHCRGAEKLFMHPQFKAWEKKHGKTFSKAAK